MSKTPEPSLEWEITTQCNYHCDYCCAKTRMLVTNRHGSDETIAAMFKLLDELPGEWSVKLIGGEPLIHPRFFEIVQHTIDAGHTLVITTNFSLPLKRIRQLAETAGDKLTVLTASLHLTEVKDVDEFIAKAAEFNRIKHPATVFLVTSVCLEEKFGELQGIAEKLEAAGVRFAFQALKVDGKFVKYSNAEIEQGIVDKFVENTDKIRGADLYGTLCHTGELFFRVNVDGQVVRCYNSQPLYNLGNVTDGTFRRFTEAKPCLAARCTCTVPANRGMILYGQKASPMQMALAQGEGLVRRVQNKLSHSDKQSVDLVES